MQTPTQSPPPAQPQAPAAPAEVSRAPVTITTTGRDGQAVTIKIPATRDEVRELLNRREQLSDQLNSVTSRRREIAAEIAEAPTGPTRTGLEDRLILLDNRILQLEGDLATTGRQLASAPAETMDASQSQPSGGGDFEEGLMIGGFLTLLFMSVVLLVLRRRWTKRTTVPGQLGYDAGQRFERLEQGMDAIAIEIERVSEGQRFVTKLLSESHSPGAAARGIGEPLPVESESRRKR